MMKGTKTGLPAMPATPKGQKKGTFSAMGSALSKVGKIFDSKGAELIWDPKTKKFSVDQIPK